MAVFKLQNFSRELNTNEILDIIQVIYFNLTFLFSEPTVTIEANDGRIHAHQGSDVEFKCLIKGMLQKPAYVFW